MVILKELLTIKKLYLTLYEALEKHDREETVKFLVKEKATLVKTESDIENMEPAAIVQAVQQMEKCLNDHLRQHPDYRTNLKSIIAATSPGDSKDAMNEISTTFTDFVDVFNNKAIKSLGAGDDKKTACTTFAKLLRGGDVLASYVPFDGDDKDIFQEKINRVIAAADADPDV